MCIIMEFTKRVFVLVFISLVVIGMLSLGFAYAKSENSGRGNEVRTSPDDNNEDDDKDEFERRVNVKDSEIEERIKSKIENDKDRERKVTEFRRKIKENNGEIEIREKMIKIKEIGEKKKEISSGKFKAITEVDLTSEDDSRGKVLKAILSDGRIADIELMPDEASAIALAELKARCEEINCKIELKDIVKNKKNLLAYELETEKDSRILFIFKKKMKLIAIVDAETGEIIQIKKPWWKFLARERNEEGELVNGLNETVTGTKVTLCHIPPGNPAARHTITIGAPAVRAHLAHGDYLGRCAGDEGNETSPGNETMPGNETAPGNQTNGNVTMPGNQTNQTINLIAGVGVGSIA